MTFIIVFLPKEDGDCQEKIKGRCADLLQTGARSCKDISENCGLSA
jgi:hypothetical protein